MFQKKPIIIILTTSIMVALISTLIIVYLGKNDKITKKINSKSKKTFHKRKNKKKKNSSIDKILSKLELSEDQKLKIREVKKKRLLQKDERKKIKELKKKLEKAFKDNTSYGEILNLYEQRQNLKARTELTKFKYILEIRKILNPEQRKKFQKLKKKYKHRLKKKKF